MWVSRFFSFLLHVFSVASELTAAEIELLNDGRHCDGYQRAATQRFSRRGSARGLGRGRRLRASVEMVRPVGKGDHRLGRECFSFGVRTATRRGALPDDGQVALLHVRDDRHGHVHRPGGRGRVVDAVVQGRK